MGQPHRPRLLELCSCFHLYWGPQLGAPSCFTCRHHSTLSFPVLASPGLFSATVHSGSPSSKFTKLARVCSVSLFQHRQLLVHTLGVLNLAAYGGGHRETKDRGSHIRRANGRCKKQQNLCRRLALRQTDNHTAHQILKFPTKLQWGSVMCPSQMSSVPGTGLLDTFLTLFQLTEVHFVLSW